MAVVIWSGRSKINCTWERKEGERRWFGEQKKGSTSWRTSRREKWKKLFTGNLKLNIPSIYTSSIVDSHHKFRSSLVFLSVFFPTFVLQSTLKFFSTVFFAVWNLFTTCIFLPRLFHVFKDENLRICDFFKKIWGKIKFMFNFDLL